jgi:hypothetical protein
MQTRATVLIGGAGVGLTLVGKSGTGWVAIVSGILAVIAAALAVVLAYDGGRAGVSLLGDAGRGSP